MRIIDFFLDHDGAGAQRALRDAIVGQARGDSEFHP